MFGVLGGLFGLLIVASVRDDVAHGADADPIVVALAAAQVLMALAEVVSGVFPWIGRSWARVVATVVCAVSLVSGVLLLLQGTPSGLAGILLNLGVIVTVNREDVADRCR